MSAAAEERAKNVILALAAEKGLDVKGGNTRRTSSRFCLSVEHGDYNGTELFGVGTDRFIWVSYKANGTNKIRMTSANFVQDGVIEFDPSSVSAPEEGKEISSWERFPHGAAYVLKQDGYDVSKGFDAVVYGNIPGGGMSRSASLCINLVLTLFDVNNIAVPTDGPDKFRIVKLAQRIETDYVGSPCGNLDQIMIYFAKDGMGTHYRPESQSIEYVPLGGNAKEDLAIISLDTGTMRPGLEKSTYKVRRSECDELATMAGAVFGISKLADVKDQALLNKIVARFGVEHPGKCDRLRYIYAAQKNFAEMLEAWKQGDLATVGRLFRADGIGLRDQYKISGPQLETMCDIVRTVPGVLGERMLGGGDMGASGALAYHASEEAVRKAVDLAYPRSHPEYASDYAVHVCKMVAGVTELPAFLN